MISSYSSIYSLGHSAIATLLHGDVLIEEKVDGSQISFGLENITIPDTESKEGGVYPELVVRSKGAQINLIAPEGMFKKAVEVLQGLHAAGKIRPGYIYRGEYLSKPKHNVLAYDRTPDNNIIIFDIEYGEQSFVGTEEKERLAAELGMQSVPVLAKWLLGSGQPLTADMLRSYLDRTSTLGGQKIEGIVIKPLRYDLFGRDKKVLMGKFVSEAFKEVHASDWKKEHGPKSGQDIIGEIAMNYGTPARWAKALLHLREAGKITDSPRDIGMLVAEVPKDIESECHYELKELLWKWAWPQIRRSVTRGLPAWYKEQLMALQFEREADVQTAEAAGLSFYTFMPPLGMPPLPAGPMVGATGTVIAEGLELEKFPAAGDIGIDPDKLAEVNRLSDEITRLKNEGGPVVPQEWGATS